MLLLSDIVNTSPHTADGFIFSVIALLGAITALFVIMQRKLKKK